MNITVKDDASLTPEDRDLIARINKLSPSAMALAGLYNFGVVSMGKPYLLAPRNDTQDALFGELMEVGFCHGDVERGHFGYRSTHDGREACGIIRSLLTKEGIPVS